jgi:hypothetical protein
MLFGKPVWRIIEARVFGRMTSLILIGDVYQPLLPVHYAAVAPMARSAMTAAFKAVGLDDCDKLSEGEP